MRLFAITDSAFPGEIWLCVVDHLEADDDRASMAALVRCNKQLCKLIQKRLYNTFRTMQPGPQGVIRSLETFIEAVVIRNPQLAELVKHVVIDKICVNIDDEPAALGVANLVREVTEHLGFDTSKLFNRPTPDYAENCRVLVEAVPCVLKKLETMQVGTYDLVNHQRWLTEWPQLSPMNRFANAIAESLQSVTIDIGPKGEGLKTLESIGVLSEAAPALRYMRVVMFHGKRLVTQQTPDPVTENAKALEALKGITHIGMDYHIVEVAQGFPFLLHCPNIKALAYMEGELEPRDARLSRSHQDIVDGGWKKWRRIAGSTHLNLNRLLGKSRAEVARSAQVFTLRHHSKLEDLIIFQDAVVYASMARDKVSEARAEAEAKDYSESSHVSKRLTGLLPPSLKRFYLGDVDQKLFAGEVRIYCAEDEDAKAWTEDEKRTVERLFAKTDVAYEFIVPEI
ncbi:hypothetical protein F5Y13DRAFT_190284 [Hypoxylon sp. FL1857]|nr:hypothetical protein F5Y13DRAFT_190284 [Hypoxylon sp. FL1857]